MNNDEKTYSGRAYLLGVPLWRVELTETKWEKAFISYRSLKGKVFYYKPFK